MPLLFDEHALLWYQYLPEELKANKETLTSAFLEKYGTTNADRLLAYDEAVKRKQRKEEDVTDYINDVTELARKSQTLDRFLMDKFMFHARPEYIMHAVGHDDGKIPQDIEKRLRVAEVAERIKKKAEASEVEAINSVFENLQKKVDEISNKVLRDPECVNQVCENSATLSKFRKCVCESKFS